jgi:hypothetical protein
MLSLPGYKTALFPGIKPPFSREIFCPEKNTIGQKGAKNDHFQVLHKGRNLAAIICVLSKIQVTGIPDDSIGWGRRS